MELIVLRRKNTISPGMLEKVQLVTRLTTKIFEDATRTRVVLGLEQLGALSKVPSFKLFKMGLE